MWPETVEVKPGETTTLSPGQIKVVGNVGVLWYTVKDVEGESLGTEASPGHALTLPAGKYVVEIDAEKRIKTLTDNQRKMDVELEAGEISPAARMSRLGDVASHREIGCGRHRSATGTPAAEQGEKLGGS